MRKISILMLTAFALVPLICPSPLGRKISRKTAFKLVQEALATKGLRVPPSQISQMTDYWSPEFFNFESLLGQSGDQPDAALRNYFAVNPWNGDVWDAMECERITSPAIEKMQAVIWKRSGLPEEARQPLHYLHPGTCAAKDE